MKKIVIKNLSNQTAILNISNKEILLPAQKSYLCDISGDTFIFSVYPKKHSEFNFLNSDFVVLSKYVIYVKNDEELVYLDYKEALSFGVSNHKYYRFFVMEKEYNCDCEIMDESKNSNYKLDFLVNLPLAILFEGFGIAIISIIAGWLFKSFVVGIAVAVLLIICVAIYEVLEEVVFDKLIKKASSKSDFFKKTNQPKDFEECSKSEYIKACFKANNR